MVNLTPLLVTPYLSRSRDVDDNGVERTQKKSQVEKNKSLVPVEWYEKQVETLIPSLDDPQDYCASDRIASAASMMRIPW